MKNQGWEGDDRTPLGLSSPEALKAIDFYLSLRPYNGTDFFATGAPEQQEVMLDGKVAMAIMWSDYIPSLIEKGRERQIAFGFATIPGGASMLAGGAFYVNRASRHSREAAQFVAYMMRPELQRQLLMKGLCSALRDAYSGPEGESVEYGEALRSALEQGTYMLEAGPEADAVSQVITEQLQRAWRGRVTSNEALAQAQATIEAKRRDIWSVLRNE